MLKIYHNPRCMKSRQTLKLIQDANKEVEIVEYLKEVPSKEELVNLLQKLRMKPLELIRKGEDIFKNYYKGKELSEDEWIDAMIRDPKLIERPIVVKDNKAVLGRPPENVKELL